MHAIVPQLAWFHRNTLRRLREYLTVDRRDIEGSFEDGKGLYERIDAWFEAFAYYWSLHCDRCDEAVMLVLDAYSHTSKTLTVSAGGRYQKLAVREYATWPLPADAARNWFAVRCER